MAEYSPGLEGVIAGETALCTITEEGLFYRGYAIGDLAEHCSFEEVAFLLLHGELPTAGELAAFVVDLASQRTLAPELSELVSRIPAAAPAMDALRTAVSLQAHFDPEVADGSHDANVRKTVRLLAQAPALIGTWYRGRAGRPPAESDSSGCHAAYLLRQLGPPDAADDPDGVRLLDVSLILYAEHELNASTFGARVTVSTLADLHSGIVTGIGALKGPLHGGANEKAIEMLLEVESPEAAEAWVLGRLSRRERIMGFGHRVVRKGDSRAGILRDLAASLAVKRGDTRLLQIADTIQGVVEREKGLKPNVDFPCGWAYHLLGLPVELYTPIFVASRISGWAAHIIEQLDNNRLIRPRAIYTGPPPRAVPPINAR
jgi:2-methylcitrate synthase/citrate synthase II